MRNLYFIVACLFSLTACQWDLDKLDLDGNVYNCEETCVNGLCDEQNVCVCSDGWSGKDCDLVEMTFEKVIKLPDYINNDGINLSGSIVNFIEIAIDEGYIIGGSRVKPLSQPSFAESMIANVNNLGEIVWVKTFEKYYSFSSILLLNDNYFIVSDSFLIKLDTYGEIVWEEQYTEKITNIFIIENSKLLLVGYENWFAKIDLDGELILGYSFNNGFNFFVNEAQIDGNEILIVSSVNNSSYGNTNGASDVMLYKFGLGGNLFWSKNFGGSSADYGVTIDQTYSSNYLVVGYSYSNDFDLENNFGDKDAWVFECDKGKNLLWSKNYGGSNKDHFNSIQKTNDGNYILAGYTFSSDFDVSFNNGKNDFWLVKIDPSGNIFWEKTYGTSDNESLSAMLATSDGGFIMIGSQNGKDIYIVKTDANGEI